MIKRLVLSSILTASLTSCDGAPLLISVSTPAPSMGIAPTVPPAPLPAASASIAVAPTPSPTPTPSPSPSPEPTAKPTPEPSIEPEEPKLVKIKIRAAIVRGSGDIVPVARTRFFMTPYNLTAIQAELAIKNKAGPKPKLSDSASYAEYDADMREWEKIAYEGLNEAADAASNGLLTRRFTTDLDGEATIEVEPGNWYITGAYSINAGRSNIYWFDARFKIDEDTESIELSNDNGEVINSSY